MLLTLDEVFTFSNTKNCLYVNRIVLIKLCSFSVLVNIYWCFRDTSSVSKLLQLFRCV